MMTTERIDDLACEDGWHQLIPMLSRFWWARRHGRVVLHCLRCERDVAAYDSKSDALAALEIETHRRWRKRGLEP
jgi:hypothetical protein